MNQLISSTGFLILNVLVVAICSVMGLCFLTFPHPRGEAMISYRISLRVLAVAYFVLAFINLTTTIMSVQIIDLFSFPTLVISSLQALLFTTTLLTLLNPERISRIVVIKHLVPVVLGMLIFVGLTISFGDPVLLSFQDVHAHILAPTVFLRLVFFAAYLYQLIQCIRMFRLEERKYQEKIDNYFADPVKLELHWVRYAFYSALSIGVLALCSTFISSLLFTFVFTVIYSLFYLTFAIFYIQYDQFYKLIEPVVSPVQNVENTLQMVGSRKFVWAELRQDIFTGKPYLAQGYTIDDMARQFNIKRAMLSSFINAEEKMNFNAWINSLRIEEAKRLMLVRPDLTMTDIAEEVGFTELSNFSRQFKISTKVTPSVWRKSSSIPSDLP